MKVHEIYILIKLFKNKEKVFDFLKNLIDSIDFVKWSNLIQEWYKKYPYKNFSCAVFQIL